jgi:hypothetical protein
MDPSIRHGIFQPATVSIDLVRVIKLFCSERSTEMETTVCTVNSARCPVTMPTPNKPHVNVFRSTSLSITTQNKKQKLRHLLASSHYDLTA